jgi:AcrR family transcriptional regulator
MPRRKQSGTEAAPVARTTILEAAIALLREQRVGDVTTDQVAQRADCAKGLVHYHFRGKDQLLAAAGSRLWETRADAWSLALGSPEPQRAIAAAWETLGTETANGTAAACAAIGLRANELVVQSVNSGRSAFAKSLTAALSGLLSRMGLSPTVPASELGTLLAATAEGIGLQLGSGADRAELEQAWAAFWVGLLALTRPQNR